MRSKPGLDVASLALTALLCGCSTSAFEYHSRNEIPSGPGLITGAQGAFVVGTSGLRETAAAAPAAAPEACSNAEFESYRSYLRAKSDSSEEYRQFLEWREWRRYQEWRHGADGQRK